jgi:glutamate/aspartate transport system substrate-binding protein
MKPIYLIGCAVAAMVFAGTANAEELTGTLKNIKESGAITLGYRDSSIPFSYLDSARSRSASRSIFATRSSTR